MGAALLGAISAGFSVLGGISGMQAGRQNAAYATAEGKQDVLNSQAEANRAHRENALKLSSIRATIGAQGSTDEGSPMLAYLDSVKNASLDEQDILFSGKLKQRSKKYEADIYRRGASMSLLGGFADATRSLGSTLLKNP